MTHTEANERKMEIKKVEERRKELMKLFGGKLYLRYL
jgi:t-SNARE complex subunit (syntaxin)